MDNEQARRLAKAISRLNIQRRIVARREHKLAISRRLFEKLLASEASISKEIEGVKIIPMQQEPYKTAHERRIESRGIYWLHKLKILSVLVWFVSLCCLAFGQKQASQLLVLTQPKPVTSVLAMPSVQALPSPVAYQDQSYFRVQIQWTNNFAVDGFNVRYGLNTNALTNVVFSTRTNLTIGPLVDGQAYWISATTIVTNSGFPTESTPIYCGPVVAPCWVMMATYTRAIFSRGVTGKTNLMQFASDVDGTNWQTAKSFVGNGSVQMFIRTNATKEFFRVIQK